MKKKTTAILLAVLLIAALLCGCGSSSAKGESYYVDNGYYYDEEPVYEEAAYAYDGDYWADAPAAAAPVPDPLPPQDGGTQSEPSGDAQNGAKLIYTADLDMETMAFDEAVTALGQLTAQVGGYYESSSITESGSTRRASFTVRVPAQNYRLFVDTAGDLCHMLSQEEYTEDVSEAYYDTAGRLETQKTKLARLQALLAEAEDMEDIIALESAISETEEMIDWYSGTLRRYDAKVDYSTVSIYLREVKVYEPEPDPTYGARLGAAFTDGLRGFAEGLGDILVALAYSWLWLLLIAAVVVLILWLTRKRRAAKKAARAERKARAAAAASQPVQYSQPAETEKEEDKAD